MTIKSFFGATCACLVIVSFSANAAPITATWTGGDANWDDASHWLFGSPPSSATFPDNDGDTFEVRIDGGNQIASTVGLNLDVAIDTLDIGNGDHLRMFNGRRLTVAQGSITNAGTLTVLGGNSLLILGADTTLAGGGVVDMQSLSGSISGTGINLSNQDNTIRGTGQISVGTITNAGVVHANNSSTRLSLTSQSSQFSTNTGTFKATDGGTLRLAGRIDNAGGTIRAEDGSVVELFSGFIRNGTLSTEGTGVIRRPTSPSLQALSMADVTIDGRFEKSNSSSTSLSGTTTNLGTIALLSTGDLTVLQFSGTSILQGGGEVVLSDNANNEIATSNVADELVNIDNHISGGGRFTGLDGIKIDNRGTIEANTTTPLIMDVGTQGHVHNTGILTATGSGTLVLQDLDNTNFSNTDGVTTGQVTAAGGIIKLVNTTLTGAAAANLAASGSGEIQLEDSMLADGVVSLADSGKLRSVAGINTVAEHITGTAGTQVIADAGSLLRLGPGMPTMNNDTTIQAINGSSIEVLATAFDNTGGKLEALGSGSVIKTTETVFGGTIRTDAEGSIVNTGVLKNTSGGILNIEAQNLVNFDSSNSGIVRAENGILRLAGNIERGNVQVAGSGEFELLGGMVDRSTIDIDPMASVRSTSGTNLLKGEIAVGNGASVTAEAGSRLSLSTNFGSSVNGGLLQAREGSTLALSGLPLDNSGGLIEAIGASTIELAGMSVIGGTIHTSADSSLRVIGGRLDGRTQAITLDANAFIDDNSLGLLGTISNQRSIQVQSTSPLGGLRVEEGTVILEGGGTVRLAGTSAGITRGTNGTKLVNADNTISGTGRINIGVDNNGTIDADVNGSNLTVLLSPFSNDVLRNSGLAQASNGGRLILQGFSANELSPVNNLSGTIAARDESRVFLQGVEVSNGTLETTGTGEIQVGLRSGSLPDAVLNNVTNTGHLIVRDTAELGLQGTIRNTGTFEVTGLAQGGANYIQTAGETIVDGSLDVNSVSVDGGVLSGGGNINSNVFNSNGGLVSPGNSPGTLSIIGDYTQDDPSQGGIDGELFIELGGLIAGDEYDVLDVSGTATLGGVLTTDFIDSGNGLFSASAGDVFDILSAETIAGEFDLLTLAVLGDGLFWDVNYLTDFSGTTDIVRLSVSAVPVPAAVWLFGSGFLGLIGMARRKKA